MGLPETIAWRTLPRLAPYLAIYSLLPVVYCVSLWQCWRQRKDPSFLWEKLALLSMVGLFLLLEVAESVNWLRLYAVSIPGIVLLIWTLDRTPKIRSYAVTLLWVGVACLAARQTILSRPTYSLRVELPGGHAATTPQSYEKLHWIEQRTEPGEFFLEAAWPGMYIPCTCRIRCMWPLWIDSTLLARRISNWRFNS